MRHLLTIDDLTDQDVEVILGRARAHLYEGRGGSQRREAILGLLFLTSSLRTRLGFAAAAHRVGMNVVDVSETRWGSGMSAPESFQDTLRTVAGMTDGVVVRSDFQLERARIAGAAVAPIINGGDRDGEHPTQALIDLLAIEEEVGNIGDLNLAICGDLTMRATRSLLALLNRRPPQSLTLIAPASRSDHGVDLSHELTSRLQVREHLDLADIDVVSMCGLPPGDGDRKLDDDERAPYVLTVRRLSTLRQGGVVLSPMPVIDEIDHKARVDPRIRMFAQSDRSVALRMAVLERFVLDAG